MSFLLAQQIVLASGNLGKIKEIQYTKMQEDRKSVV